MKPWAEDVVTVIASGWSAGSLAEPPRGIGITIGVNDSCLHAVCRFAVSMDRLWTENRWAKLCDNVERRYIHHAHIRLSALKRLEDRPPWLHPFECDYKSTVPSDAAGTLNGTNSGMCALNLAYQMRPRLLVLIGFDMNRSPDGRAYWHLPYPWALDRGNTSGGKYIAWAAQFEAFATACRREKIDVVNTSMTSAITTFKKAPLESLR
jgi:hypothetical protein